MSEEAVNQEIKNADNQKLELIKKSIEKLEKKESNFLFCVPDTQNPAASIYEIYFHANVVKNMGFNVIMLTEKPDYVIPNWIEKELTDLKHECMAGTSLKVAPDDFMIIPEIYTNVMEQTKNLPCVRIGLLQSLDYMMNSLIPGTNWKSFGIKNIITTSLTLKELLQTYYGVNFFNVKTYDVGIPSYFSKPKLPQRPVISIIGRNPNDISKLVKLFFSRYPQYSWVTFDPMLTQSKPPKQMRRVDFAKRLQSNFAAVWIDRISSFGTFPLECMKSGTIPVALLPDIIPDYLIDRNNENNLIENAGVWTNNYYDLPILLGETLIKYLDDNIPSELYETMDAVASKYTQENSESQLVELYQSFIDERVSLFKNTIEVKTDTPKK